MSDRRLITAEPLWRSMTGSGNRAPHPPEDYDAQIVRTIPYLDLMHQETINLASSLDRPPTLWLDTGCGTGTLVRTALDRLPHTRFLLADPSEQMLDRARKKLAGEERVQFLRPTGTQGLMGLIDKSPDVITAIQCHHYLSKVERKKAVEVCFESLQEGGLFVTFENIRPFTARGIEIGKRNWGRFQSEMGKSAAEVNTILARLDKEYFPITAEEHLALLREAGFRTVELFWYSHMQAGLYGLK